ncbi:MAG: hypothetical protein H7Y43_12755 [Akkermansiaceae bacterium]|nr:hypothetical protein [Verrucomicrobiales bacterium]
MEWLAYSRRQLKVNMRPYIQSLFRVTIVAFLLCLSGALCGEAKAQASFRARVSSVSVLTNTAITYTFSLTNLAFEPLNVFVTNVFSAGVRDIMVTNNYDSATAVNLTNRLVLNVPDLQNSLSSEITVTLFTTNAGSLTNFVTFFVDSPSNSFSTNLVTLVTNLVPVETDLAVSITGPGPDVYVGDWITFGVTVTNLSPLTAGSIVVSNSFQSNGVQVVAVKSISPANQFVNGIAVLSPFTLTNKGSQTFKFTVQPTNAGMLPFSVSVNTGSDTNSANNRAFTNILVSNFLTNMLVVTPTPTQKFNAIIGVMEQSILLSNASPSSVPSARVNVSGIPSPNRHFNAIGTNSGNPFVVHSGALGGGESISLLMQYKVPSHQQMNNLVFTAQAMTNAADLTPPGNLIALNSTNRISRQTNYISRMLLEFPSTNGRTYTVVYDDNAAFTTPKVVRPSIVAPANWTYWLDYGPPATISPTDGGSRFYKIYVNP